jgi:hypothetical protein
MGKTIVRLLKQWGSHNPGEVAGFAPHVATKLISQGYAELHPRPEPIKPPATLDEQADAGDPPKPAPAAASKKSTTKKSS